MHKQDIPKSICNANETHLSTLCGRKQRLLEARHVVQALSATGTILLQNWMSQVSRREVTWFREGIKLARPIRSQICGIQMEDQYEELN